jgi:hypothetical protein
VLGAELAAADDGAADDTGADDTAADDTAADDTVADGDVVLTAAPVSEAVVDGLFDPDADAMMMMTTSAPNEMSPVSTLCRAGQGLRFCPLGVCGGMADCCCHGGG